jgi:integrase
MGYRNGPLFRAQKNGRGGSLRYQSVQERWAGYCRRVGIDCTLHQLRHTHATELVNDGVSLATIRKRLGHRNLQTTLRYAEQSDAAADAEVRAWRRRRLEH